MSARFADSFDHYSTTEIPLKWTQSFNATIQSGISRNGGQAMFFSTGLANAGSVSITIDYQTTWVCGWAIYLPADPSGLSGGGTIYNLLSNGSTLMGLVIDADFTISVTAKGSTYGLSSVSIHESAWYYIEIKNILSTLGMGAATTIAVSTTVRLNGVVIIATTSATDTGVTLVSLVNPSAQANRHAFNGTISNSFGFYIDDLYIVDANIPGSSDFVGDVALGCTYPDADVSTNFSIFPTTPTTHFTKVNEHPPDYDTTYIYDDNLDDIDDFNFSPIATFTGTIPFVHFLIFARKDDSGSREIKHTVNGSTYAAGVGGYLGTPAFSLCDEYVYYKICFDVDPNGSVNWTPTVFNAERFGALIFA